MVKILKCYLYSKKSYSTLSRVQFFFANLVSQVSQQNLTQTMMNFQQGVMTMKHVVETHTKQNGT